MPYRIDAQGRPVEASPRVASAARGAMAAAGVFVVVTIVSSWVTSSRHDEAARWVAHTGEVRVAIADATALVERAAGRTPVDFAKAPEAGRLRNAVARIGELTRDNPRQAARAAGLERLTGGLPANSSDLGWTSNIEAARETLHEMKVEEDILLDARELERSGAAKRASSWFLACAILSVTLTAIAFVLMRKYVRTLGSAAKLIRASEERFRLVAEHVSDLVWVHALDGTREYVSPSCERLLGYTADEVLAMAPFEPMHEDDRAESRVHMRRLVEDPEYSGVIRHRFRTRSGEYRWFESHVAVARDEQGKALRFHSASRDVTARKEAEGQLIVAKEAAEGATRAKSDFLARMSHEIRTPMNGVLGMTDLALQTDLTSEQRDYIATARASAESLLEIIDDVLDFSKIEAGKLRLEATPFGLRETLGRVLKGLAHRAHEKGLELLVRVPSKVPDDLVGDPHRLGQILLNLVGNAIKFTDRGEIVLEVQSLSTSAASTTSLEFRVVDTGIGIPPEQQQLIFEAFAQTDEATTRKFGGTGLGLAICQQLVAMMRGRMWVESTLGHGSAFAFTVELALDDAVPSSRAAIAPPPKLSGVPVLVVDDNETSRSITVELLSAWRMNPYAASSAAEAVRVARSCRGAGAPLQIVLLDADLDGVDSPWMIAELRGAIGSEKTPVLLLGTTAGPLKTPVEDHIGFVARLIKPLIPSTLLEAMQALLSGTTPPPAITERPTAKTPRRILIAEDNVVNRKVATAALTKAGHAIFAVENGRLALAAIAKERFDAVLMDVQMPEMDGLEATRRIRAMESSSSERTPIIALTAQAMRGDEQRCLDAGMDAYVAKPLVVAEVIAVIDRITAASSAALTAPLACPIATYDAVALARLLGDDAQLVAEAIDLYLSEAPRLLRQVSKAIEDGDANAVGRAAHELKGALMSMNGRRASESAALIEYAGRAGDVATARTKLPDLERELDALGRALTTQRAA